jgi:hypothetical protein
MAVSSPVVGDAAVVGDETIVGGARFGEFLQYLGSPLFGHRVSLELTYNGGNQLLVKRLSALASVSRRLRF